MRYRYYTSHALLQGRKEHAGSVPRVSAPDVEALVRDALRRELSIAEEVSDKDLIAEHVAEVIIRRDRIEVKIRSDADGEEPASPGKLEIPFSPTIGAQKGITREPTNNGQIHAAAREKLWIAIRRACQWVEAVKSGEVDSFAKIAGREELVERHVRRLAVLAFVAPNLLNALANCSSPAELTVSTLAQTLPYCWAKQETMFR